MNKIDEKSAARLLRENDNILILTHRNPDGDTIGSGFALLHALKKLGKTVKVVCTDPFPEKYGYIAHSNDDDVGENPYVVAVDVADMELIGAQYRAKYEHGVNLCIDHHISNKEFAENLCLRSCSATCEIIYDVIKAMDVEIDKSVADSLYTGIATDTGCFLFSSVTARTHIIAADLIEHGADFFEINRIMFETKSLGYFKLEAAALNTVEMHCGGKCAFMTVTMDMQKQAGTYIRSLIDDIGKDLGCGAIMTDLRRTSANGFSINNCVTLEELEKAVNDGTADKYITPIEKCFDTYCEIVVTEGQAKRFSNGGELSRDRLKDNISDGIYRVYSPDRQFLGLGEIEKDGEFLKVRRVYVRE